ncbi:unnamed protein product [Rotaria sp. Silwood2]|nr:unnamed protein product [Rotaria sp. Silwood2]
MTVGDFDANKQLDVAVADSENDRVFILLQYENGKFGMKTTYEGIKGSYPFFIAVAYFDDDNQVDIAIANYGANNILVLSQYVMTPSARQNGLYYLLVNNFNDDSLLMLTGNADGIFQRAATFSMGYRSAPIYLCIGDFNNDNRMDIVTANYGSDSVGILRAQDNGTFSNVTTYSMGHGCTPWSVAVRDFNNDSRLDIATANRRSGGLGIRLGHGNGTFANAMTYFTDIIIDPQSVAVGYVNNDGQLNVVMTDSSSDYVGILLGHSDGTFSDAIPCYTGTYSGPSFVSLVDLNNDSHLDLVVATTEEGFAGVFLGYGNGTFDIPQVYLTGEYSYPLAVAIGDSKHNVNGFFFE